MLDFKDVVFQFPEEEKPIIDHLDFHVNRGEFISIIGASGCGKSTIFRLINRLLEPENGEILVAGTRVAGKNPPASGKENSRKGTHGKTWGNAPVCGYMPQQDLLFPWRTVEENLCLPMELQGGISKEEQHRGFPKRSSTGERRKRWRMWDLPEKGTSVPPNCREACASALPLPGRS